MTKMTLKSFWGKQSMPSMIMMRASHRATLRLPSRLRLLIRAQPQINNSSINQHWLLASRTRLILPPPLLNLIKFNLKSKLPNYKQGQSQLSSSRSTSSSPKLFSHNSHLQMEYNRLSQFKYLINLYKMYLNLSSVNKLAIPVEWIHTC